MKEFVGKKMLIAVDGVGLVRCTMLKDTPSIVVVRGDDNKEVHIPKSKICLFSKDCEASKQVMAKKEEQDTKGLVVLFCTNPSIKCNGVQFVRKGNGFSQKDFDVFMSDCPRVCTSCTRGSKGDISRVNGQYLQEMLSDMMFGEYPKKEKK